MAARSICSKCGKPAVSKPVIDRGCITVVEYCSNGHSYQRRFQSLDDARRYLQMKAIEAGDFTYRPDAEALAPMESGAETLESRLKPAHAPVKAKPATKPAPAPLPPMEEVKLKHPLWDVDDATIRRLFDETATWKSKSESKTHLSEAKNWYRLAQEEANMNDDPTTPDRPYRQVSGLPNGWGWDRDGERRGGLFDGNGHHILTCSHEPPCVSMDSPCYVMAWEVQLNRRLNTQSGVLGDGRYRLTREDGHWVVFDTDTQHFIRGTNGASPGEAAGFAVTVIGDVNVQRQGQPNPGGHVVNPRFQVGQRVTRRGQALGGTITEVNQDGWTSWENRQPHWVYRVDFGNGNTMAAEEGELIQYSRFSTGDRVSYGNGNLNGVIVGVDLNTTPPSYQVSFDMGPGHTNRLLLRENELNPIDLVLTCPTHGEYRASTADAECPSCEDNLDENGEENGDENGEASAGVRYLTGDLIEEISAGVGVRVGVVQEATDADMLINQSDPDNAVVGVRWLDATGRPTGDRWVVRQDEIRQATQTVSCRRHGSYHRSNIYTPCPTCAPAVADLQMQNRPDVQTCTHCGSTLSEEDDPFDDRAPVCAACREASSEFPEGYSAVWRDGRRQLTFKESPQDAGVEIEPIVGLTNYNGSPQQAWAAEANRVLGGDVQSREIRAMHDSSTDIYEFVSPGHDLMGTGASWQEALDDAIFKSTGRRKNPEVKEVPLPTGGTLPLPAEYSLTPYDNGAQQALRYDKQSTIEGTYPPLSYGATASPFNLVREAWEHKIRRENPTNGQGEESLHVSRLSNGNWVFGTLAAIQEAVRNSDFSKVATGPDLLATYENFAGIAPKTRASYGGKVTTEDVAQNALAKPSEEKYRVRLTDGRVISLYVPSNRDFRAHVMFRYEEDGKPKEVPFISLPDNIIRSKDEARHKAIEKFFEREVWQPQLKYWADKAGIPAVGERPRRRLDAEDLEVQKMFEQLQPKPHRRTRLSITDPALVIPAPQRWIVLTETMSGLAPIDTCSEGKGPDHPCTYDSELLAWAEVDDDIAEMQRQFDEGERDDVDTRDMYAVVPYDPAIHDQQWREATGQSITPTLKTSGLVGSQASNIGAIDTCPAHQV